MISIKKYSNRRLYNTDSSSYITQADIVNLIKKKIPLKIIDMNKKDITSSILMQIIINKQTAGKNLIPEEFLKQIILFNENNKASDMFIFLSKILNISNSNDIIDKEISGKLSNLKSQIDIVKKEKNFSDFLLNFNKS